MASALNRLAVCFQIRAILHGDCQYFVLRRYKIEAVSYRTLKFIRHKQINWDKLAKFAGYANGKSASVCWLPLKNKVAKLFKEENEGDEKGGAMSGQPSSSKTPKNRRAAKREADDDENPTPAKKARAKSTGKGKGKAAAKIKKEEPVKEELVEEEPIEEEPIKEEPIKEEPVEDEAGDEHEGDIP